MSLDPPGTDRYCLHFLTITSHVPSSKPRPGMTRSNSTCDNRENLVRNGFLTVPTVTGELKGTCKGLPSFLFLCWWLARTPPGVTSADLLMEMADARFELGLKDVGYINADAIDIWLEAKHTPTVSTVHPPNSG